MVAFLAIHFFGFSDVEANAEKEGKKVRLGNRKPVAR